MIVTVEGNFPYWVELVLDPANESNLAMEVGERHVRSRHGRSKGERRGEAAWVTLDARCAAQWDRCWLTLLGGSRYRAGHFPALQFPPFKR
jgi:hypothetical protein